MPDAREEEQTPRYVEITIAVPVYAREESPSIWAWESLLNVPNNVVVVDARDIESGERIIDMHGNSYRQEEL